MTKETVTREQHTDNAVAEYSGATQSVKALIRGLDVLTAMNDLSPATVTQLVQETGYPKATVIRLLQTLCREGYVEELAAGRGYQIRAKVLSLSRALSAEHRYQQAAEQPLKDLGLVLKWPAQLLIRDGHSMVIEASNRDTAPIKLQTLERRRFQILKSAAGMVYLSVLPIAEAKGLIREAVESLGQNLDEKPLTRKSRVTLEADFLQQVEEIGNAGYAMKEYDVLSSGMQALAIPLIVDQRPIGGLTLIHYKQYMSQTQLRKTVLPTLRKTAMVIADNLKRG